MTNRQNGFYAFRQAHAVIFWMHSQSLVQLHLWRHTKRPETCYKRYGIIQQFSAVTETPSSYQKNLPTNTYHFPPKKIQKRKTLETSPPIPPKILPKKFLPNKNFTPKPWRKTTYFPMNILRAILNFYCWWFRNPGNHQLILLVVYPIICGPCVKNSQPMVFSPRRISEPSTVWLKGMACWLRTQLGTPRPLELGELARGNHGNGERWWWWWWRDFFCSQFGCFVLFVVFGGFDDLGSPNMFFFSKVCFFWLVRWFLPLWMGVKSSERFGLAPNIMRHPWDFPGINTTQPRLRGRSGDSSNGWLARFSAPDMFSVVRKLELTGMVRGCGSRRKKQNWLDINVSWNTIVFSDCYSFSHNSTWFSGKWLFLKGNDPIEGIQASQFHFLWIVSDFQIIRGHG